MGITLTLVVLVAMLWPCVLGWIASVESAEEARWHADARQTREQGK